MLSPAHRLDRPVDTRTFFLQIHSNDPIRPRTSVALRCTVVEPVIPETPVLYFPRVSPSQTGERTISIECRAPVELVEALPSHPALRTELAEGGKTILGRRYSLRVIASADTLAPGVVELPIQLNLKGVASDGAQLVARVRVWAE